MQRGQQHQRVQRQIRRRLIFLLLCCIRLLARRLPSDLGKFPFDDLNFAVRIGSNSSDCLSGSRGRRASAHVCMRCEVCGGVQCVAVGGSDFAVAAAGEKKSRATPLSETTRQHHHRKCATVVSGRRRLCPSSVMRFNAASFAVCCCCWRARRRRTLSLQLPPPAATRSLLHSNTDSLPLSISTRTHSLAVMSASALPKEMRAVEAKGGQTSCTPCACPKHSMQRRMRSRGGGSKLQ